MNSFNIRKATKTDLNRIIELGGMLQKESKEYEPTLLFDEQSAYTHYQGELENDNALIIAAITNDEIVGYQYSFITILDYLSRGNIECTLEALYVLPEHRGKGIAKQLVNTSERWAIEEKRVNRIKANIYSGNTASEQLHLKRGFTPYCTEYIRYVNQSH